MTQAIEQLSEKKCRACRGDMEKLSPDAVCKHISMLSGWELTGDGGEIHKHWKLKDFAAGIEFINQVAALAEAEGHHPDLHLEGYRKVWIALSTHAIGGLSENDFIMAAKIDKLPVRLRT